ncbi:MAG TPA: ABC transporter permease [Actinomycetota bacterium]|nr:ABC transporter permease [Actinomycetota bacterium]
MVTTIDVIERTSEPPRLRVLARVRELYAHREILLNLVRKELKVKYAASVLGAIWSLLNPVVFLGVFTFVSFALDNNVPNYPVYLLSGLLAWNLFSTSVTQGARSVIDNANLVKKVYFPREILPLSQIGVALVDFVLQTLVLLLLMIATGYDFRVGTLALWPLAFFTLLVFTVAMSFWLSAMNVRYRDIQHLLNLGLLVWFWFTPIVYASHFVQEKLAAYQPFGFTSFYLYLLNPLASIVVGFQRALYGVVTPQGASEPVLVQVSVGWVATILAGVALGSVVLLWSTWRTFFRLSGDFAEEL